MGCGEGGRRREVYIQSFVHKGILWRFSILVEFNGVLTVFWSFTGSL